MTSQRLATRSAERSGTSCPVCAAAAQPGQLVCLECGSRITLAYRRPPSWKVPVAITVLVLLLAVGGGAVAFQAIDDDAKREASATPAQPREGAQGDGAESERAPTDADDETPGSAPDEEQQPDGARRDGARRDDESPPNPVPPADDAGGLTKSGDLYTWPRSLSAFTVVLLSAEDRGSATSFARSAGSSPRTKIGVLRSDDFETLPTGFFVVFGGEYETRERADRAAASLAGRFPGAFAQLVQR